MNFNQYKAAVQRYNLLLEILKDTPNRDARRAYSRELDKIGAQIERYHAEVTETTGVSS